MNKCEQCEIRPRNFFHFFSFTFGKASEMMPNRNCFRIICEYREPYVDSCTSRQIILYTSSIHTITFISSFEIRKKRLHIYLRNVDYWLFNWYFTKTDWDTKINKSRQWLGSMNFKISTRKLKRIIYSTKINHLRLQTNTAEKFFFKNYPERGEVNK